MHPTLLTPRFGQAATLDAFVAALDGGTRLLALVGPPGVGKSRLAADGLRALTGGRRSMLWLEASGHGLDDVLGALLRQLDIVAPAGRRDAVIARALGESPRVLVLDGVGHLLDDLPRHLARWLGESDDLAVVLTSRIRPDLLDAQVLRVAPLEAADVDAPAPALLADRIMRAGGRVDDAEALVACARALDGLPLAIELMAKRAAVFGLEAVLQTLGRDPDDGAPDPLLDLTGKDLGGSPVSMRRALDAAWDGLDAAARETLLALALSTGPLAPAALAPLVPTTDWMGAIERLEAASCLVPERGDIGTQLRLYGAVRAYAREQFGQLAPATRQALVARFRDALGQTAIDSLVALRTPRGMAALATLRARRGDLDRALARVRANEADLPSLRAALASGELARWDRIDDDALRALEDVLESATRTRADIADGPVAQALDEVAAEAIVSLAAVQLALDHDRVPALVERGRAICATHPERFAALQVEGLRAHLAVTPTDATPLEQFVEARGDVRDEVTGRVHVALGYAYLWSGRVAEARRAYETAVSILERAGGPASLGWAVENRATGHLWADRPELAAGDLERALELSREIGPRNPRMLNTLRVFGWTLLDLGELEAASDALEQCMAMSRLLYEDTRAQAWLLLRLPLGSIAAEEGALDEAQAHFTAVATGWEDPEERSRAVLELGSLAARRNDFSAAAERFAEARALAPETPFAVAATSGLALCHAMAANWDEAEREFEVAEARLDEIGMAALSVHVALDGAAIALQREEVGTDCDLAQLRELGVVDVLARALRPEGELTPLFRRAANVRRRMRQLVDSLPEGVRSSVCAEAADPDATAFVCDLEQTRFRFPGTDWFDTGRKKLLARLLHALFEAHAETRVATFDDLVEAGWPGEQILYDAATNRLHKALSQLRKLPGVRDHLEHTDEGWSLTPSVRQLRLPL